MTVTRYWYQVGRTIHTRIGPEPHPNDPTICLCATEQIAGHIVNAHNQAINAERSQTTAWPRLGAVG